MGAHEDVHSSRFASIRTHVRSNAVAYLALFFSIAGVSYAATIAPRDSVVSKSIKDGQVRAQDLGASARDTFPIVENVGLGGESTWRLGPSNLEIFTRCDSSPSFSLRNEGPGNATLDWLFVKPVGPDIINADGLTLTPTNGSAFNFNEDRIEGQFIFADGAGVTTVNLHAFDAFASSSDCQVKGIANYAPNP